ncbi:MAG: branched-chain amino acid ABC transporter permease [Actinobacteria bacterium]|nr:branched-chain amino acid ABC transporter permease [Actinomycetota bacterium]
MPTIAVVCVLACVPLVWRNDYIVSVLTLGVLSSLMAQSWNLTIGLCGIWNLGQLAIIAIGGYATGILTVELGISAWLALPAGVVAGGLAAAIMVLPVIRLRGIYAALLTFALAEVVRLLILADGTGLTGGRAGLSGVPGLFDRLSYSGSLRASFWLALVLSAAVMLLVRGMVASPLGTGVDRRRQAIVATLFSGLVAGLAGGLYVTYHHGITPNFMALRPLGLLLIMVIVGGLGTVRGPVIGALVVTVLGELLGEAALWRLLALGALLLLVLLVWPAGIDGLLQRCLDKMRAWRKGGKKT